MAGALRSGLGCWAAQGPPNGLLRRRARLRRGWPPWALPTGGSTNPWPGGGWDARRSRRASGTGPRPAKP
eukprot:2295982-Alexandrium_andersonii.AAC.1